MRIGSANRGGDRTEDFRPAYSVSWWQVFWAAFGVWVLLSGVWVITSPQFSVPDESAHVMRAAAVASGTIIGERREITQGGPRPLTAVLHVAEVPAAFADIGGRHDCFAPFKGTADCAAPLAPEAGTALTTTTAGAYQPVFYSLVGLPTKWLSPVEAVFAGRALHAVVGSLLLAAATVAAWDLGGRLLVLAVILSITPMIPYLLGSINPNGVEIAGSVALWVSVPALLRTDARRYAIIAVIAAFVVAWARPLSPLIVLGIVVTAGALVIDRQVWCRMRRSGTVQLGLGLMTLSLLSSWVWVAATDATSSFIGYPDATLTGATAALESWRMTWLRLEQMVGLLGWLDTPLPDFVWWGWGLLVILFGVAAVIVGTWRQRVLVAATAVGTVLVPVMAETLTAARMGLIWQGRYTLPVAVGFVLLSGWTLVSAPHGRSAASVAAALDRITMGVVALVAVAHLLAHMGSMARYSTGPATSMVAYLWRPGWTAPLPDIALLLLAIAGSMGLIGLTFLTARKGDCVPRPPLNYVTDSHQAGHP